MRSGDACLSASLAYFTQHLREEQILCPVTQQGASRLKTTSERFQIARRQDSESSHYREMINAGGEI